MRISTPLLLVFLATIAGVTTHAQELDWTPITFESDAGEKTEAERTVISVPSKHANPNGSSVKLPLIRFRTTARNPGPPIIYLAGGPGNSGLTAAKRNQYYPGLMALRAISDVIVFDQRGTGEAEPSLTLDMRFDAPSDEPIGSPRSRAALARTADSAVKLVRSRGIDPADYNTAESADDIEAIRRAIGASRISLWGHSYGSHLGLAYIKRHGAHVSRAVFGGVNGLDDRWRYPSESQAWLEAVGAAAKDVYPDLVGSLSRSIARLDSAPALVNGTLIGADEIRTLMVLQGGESDFVKRLPIVAASLEAGQLAPYAPAIRAALRGRQLGTVMSYTMHIASGVTQQRLARIEREAPGTVLRDAINFPFSDAGFRNAWGTRDLGESFRAPVRSDIPVLFLAGSLDGRTSVSAAREVKAGFRNGRLIVLDGAAHDIYGDTPQVIDLMTRFLGGGNVADATIKVPIEFHAADEAAIIEELHSIVLQSGAEAAIDRAKTMRALGRYVPSYVITDLAFRLDRTDKRPADAIAILRAGAGMFPSTTLVFGRLGAALAAAGDTAGAISAYRRALEINPLVRFYAVQLEKLR
jgi:pimeloyl-ACP methyl ester carboxylesterase